MLIKCNHDRIHFPIDLETRADIWNDYSNILSELFGLAEADSYYIFEPLSGGRDVDADNFFSFLDCLDALNQAVKTHAQELRAKADHAEVRRIYHQENVYAWSLGLKPSVLRAEGIRDGNRGIFDWEPSPWKDIAAFKASSDFSREDTLYAINAWREAHRKAG